MGERWIGVTGLHATDNPSPGLAVARALRLADPSWRVLALPCDRSATGAYADDVFDAHALVPGPAAGSEALLGALGAIVREHPLDHVIPTIDAELGHYVALRPLLRRLGIRTLLPRAATLQARAKRRLPGLGRRAGVPVPETTVLPSAGAAWAAAPRRMYPQVLKGPLVDSTVVHTPEDFRVASAELGARHGYPLLAQPLVPGEEYDVAAVARRGELLGAAVMKKLGVTGKGTAWAGVTVDEPCLLAATRRLVRALGWTGALEAEFIRAADGRDWCFEINGRFPSWIALAAAAGANLPALLVRVAAGEPAEPVRAEPGRLFGRAVAERVFLAGDPLVGLEQGRARRALLAAWRPRPAPGAAAGTVAVTGLNAADNPSPGLTVGRSLRAAPRPLRLIGLTHEILATGGYVDGVWNEVRVVPYPSREEDGWADALIAQCRAATADCLIPTLDIEVPLVSWLSARLAAAGVATLVPPARALTAAAKPRLPSLAGDGLRVPATLTVTGPHALAAAAAALGTPFVLKGPLADACIVWTPEEARVAARRLAATWGYPLLAQEHVQGPEYGVAALVDRRHRVVGTVAVRKDVRTANGNTWAGTVVDDRALARLAARFAEALGWVGPCELEVIRHPDRGDFVIEVNPRFPAWVYLGAGALANLPWAAVRLARGERVGSLAPRPGALYVRMAWDVMAPVERLGALAVDGMVRGSVG